MKSSIWFIDEKLTSKITPGQSGPGSDGNEEIFHTPRSPPSDAVYCHTQDIPSAEDTVRVF